MVSPAGPPVFKKLLPNTAKCFAYKEFIVDRTSERIDEHRFVSSRQEPSVSRASARKRKWRARANNREQERAKRREREAERRGNETPEQKATRLANDRRKRIERRKAIVNRQNQSSFMPIFNTTLGSTLYNVSASQCNGQYVLSTKVRTVEIHTHTHQFVPNQGGAPPPPGSLYALVQRSGRKVLVRMAEESQRQQNPDETCEQPREIVESNGQEEDMERVNNAAKTSQDTNAARTSQDTNAARTSPLQVRLRVREQRQESALCALTMVNL